jgi:Fe-S cluster biogenesis protein NfuA
VLGDGTLEFRTPDETEGSPLAARLFEIDGVTGVFFGSDFISVTKSEGEWQHLKPAILGVIMEHFQSGDPVTAGEQTGYSETEGEFFAPEDAETVNTIKELLETRVRPAVAQDGGDITFHGYRDGVVFLHMRGACSGCPSSTATLRHGIENLLRHFIPEVQEVRPV